MSSDFEVKLESTETVPELIKETLSNKIPSVLGQPNSIPDGMYPQFESFKMSTTLENVPGAEYVKGFKIPKFVKVQGVFAKTPRTAGIADGAVTRFDPYSLDFEDSINWGDASITPSKAGWGVKSDYQLNDVTPLCFDRSAWSLGQITGWESYVLNTLKIKPLMNEIVLDSSVKRIHGIKFDQKDLMEIAGRKLNRYESHYELHAEKASSIRNFYLAIRYLFQSSSSNTRAVAESTRSTPVILTGVSLHNALGYSKLNTELTLINVFEVYEDGARNIPASICLSYYVKVTAGDLNSGIVKSKICHFWISNYQFRIPGGPVNKTTDVASVLFKVPDYQLFGIPRLDKSLTLSFLNADPNTWESHISIIDNKEEIFKEKIKLSDFVPFYENTSSNGYSLSSFYTAITSRSYWNPEGQFDSICLEMFSRINNKDHPFENIPKINALRKILTFFLERRNSSISTKVRINDIMGILAKEPRFHKIIIDAKNKKVEEFVNSIEGSPATRKELLSLMAKPEFYGNLPF